jgi:sucrose-6-phosphate hydrolase SacC (GH32 family)
MSADLPIDPSSSRLIDFLVGQAGGCEACGTTEGVEREDARTAYHFEGEVGSFEDPNRGVMLCRDHAAMHHAYWDEMWAEYHSGRL